ncbi:MAG: phasin family protein [Sphingobium sp.]|nr:phasin family protein [Sphingobium sp.]
MAVTPKSRAPRVAARTTKPKSQSGTLSASEALKAAEAAIEPPAAPARKAAPKAKPPMADPMAIAAASTAVDAAPEPAPAEDEPAAPASISATPEPVAPPPQPTPATAAPQAPTTPTRAEGTPIMNDVIENGKKYAEEAKAKLETAYAQMNEKAKVNVEKSTKALEEMSDIAKGNVEALVESGKIAAKAVEVLGQEAVDYSRQSFEKAQASFRSFSTVKTPTEFFQLQSQMLSTAFDDFTKEAAKSSETLVKLAGEVAQPLTARVTVVTDKMKALAA